MMNKENGKQEALSTMFIVSEVCKSFPLLLQPRSRAQILVSDKEAAMLSIST